MSDEPAVGAPAETPPEVPPETPVTATAVPAKRSGSRVRNVVACVLGGLAVVMLVVASIGVWAKATVLQRDRFTSLTEDALAEPEVQAGLAAYLTDTLFETVDVEALVADILPSALARTAPTIAAGLESTVERRLEDALGSEQVQNVLNTLIGRAYDRGMDLLQGDGLVDGINVVDGQVTINTLPLIGRGFDAIQSLGLLTNLDVPELTADGDPAQQIADLETALGRDLPDGLGQLVVYESDAVGGAQQSVQQAQRLLVLVQRGVVLLVIAALVLLAATVLIAPRRWRATMALGLGTATLLVVLRSVVRQVVEDAPGLALRPGAKAAIESILGGASASLLRLTGILLVLALAAVVVSLWRERWRRSDIVLAGAFGVFMLVIAILDANLVSLVIAVLAAIGTWFIARAVLPAPRAASAGEPRATTDPTLAPAGHDTGD